MASTGGPNGAGNFAHQIANATKTTPPAIALRLKLAQHARRPNCQAMTPKIANGPSRTPPAHPTATKNHFPPQPSPIRASPPPHPRQSSDRHKPYSKTVAQHEETQTTPATAIRNDATTATTNQTTPPSRCTTPSCAHDRPKERNKTRAVPR